MKKNKHLIATCIVQKITLLLLLLAFSLPMTAQIVINTETETNEATGEVLVHFVTQNFNNILGLQFTIDWDGDAMESSSFSEDGPLDLSPFNFGHPLPDTSAILFSWIDSEVRGVSLPDGSVLFTLGFNKLSDTDSEIIFKNYPFAIEVINTNLENIGLVSFTNEIAGLQFIRGTVSVQEDNDCEATTTGIPLADWLIELKDGEGYSRRIRSGSNGGFAFATDANTTYTLTTTPPLALWEVCVATQTITTATIEEETPLVQFNAKTSVACPFLQVDVSAPFLRRCFSNKYTVNYSNIGSALAEDAYVIIELDPTLDFESSTTPVMELGDNRLQFNLGDVTISKSGRFTFDVIVNCDESELGQTHCVEAEIFPKTDCFDRSSDWSEAELELRAECREDATLEFKIVNVGTGDMLDEQAFSIVEDMIMMYGTGSEDVFKLKSGEEFAFELPATGATYRMETEQVPHHPFHNNLGIAIEGCGENVEGDFSRGFVTMFPLAAKSKNYDIDCQENIGAYDPNDKQGFPKGVGQERWLKQNTDVEYLIRFQNTGTDTAFNIVVIDTLSTLLSPESVKLLVASHDYSFEQLDKNILRFTFANIMLPDSNINEAASHGFIRFKVSQEADLQDDLYLMNEAAIYFDFNEPIFTNTTIHKIGEEPIVPVQELAAMEAITIAPNPFDHIAFIELEEEALPNTTFKLFDVLGREVRAMPFIGDRLEVHRENLPDGIYYFELLVNSKVIRTDKLSIQSID